ncbi:hypothetical protein HW555_013100 [Spodoptera exigua]|uniref:Endonuclease/exonuclease/phosphatase domain-containing protein n=1 Tax=Spodoptera exigua TaxID=7107 RepID=A0A835G5S3_SPOEX|nr:hypothetical protein HW555_013100 [Spodoptera exigua]
MEYETDCGEDLWASFTWHRRSYLVCIVYIKPSASDAEYMSWFCKTESFLNNFKGFVLIMGDLNLKSASINVANYYCYFLSFCSLVDKNVILNHHGGMLDVVLVREGSHGVCVSSADGIVQPDAYHPPMEVERSKCHDDYKTYSNLRNTLKSRVEGAYRSYITRVESNIKLNPREFWRHISSLRSKGGFEPQVNFRGESFTGAAAAEAFAKFFASVFLTDVPRLNADSVNSFDVNHNSNYVNIFHITSEDVINGINKLKTSTKIYNKLASVVKVLCGVPMADTVGTLARASRPARAALWRPRTVTALILYQLHSLLMIEDLE